MISKDRFELATLGCALFVITLVGCSSGSGDGGDGGTAGSGGAETLRILITNDDGVEAAGIDIVVQALIEDPRNEIIVSAPAGETSGSADARVGDEPPPECVELSGDAIEAETASGYATDVWAVDGCPADAVLYALDNLYPDEPPHVVLSGINAGQNAGIVGGILISQISGTVGAAKTAACSGVPALASSQGTPHEGEDFDYEAGLVEVLAWLEDNRAALLAGEVGVENITSINIPSCQEGASVRGRVEVPLGTEVPEFVDGSIAVTPQDCESTFEDPQDDLEAFFSGFVPITPVPSNSNGTCDDLQ